MISTLRGRREWDAAAALTAATLALAGALLLPRLFSDPVGVDPYLLRTAAVSLLLLAVAFRAQLAPARPVLLALASVTVPFAAWAATPRVLTMLGTGVRYPASYMVAGAVQLAVTAGFLVAARRLLPVGVRPDLRLSSFGRRAAAVTVVSCLAFVVLALALPAPLLGRLGVAPVALGRVILFTLPGDALQAASQELEFRGLLQGTLERVMGTRVAILVQALFFGLARIAVVYEGPALSFVPVTVALGLLLGAMTWWTRSLWPAIVLHVVAEVSITVAIVPGLYGQ